jgi:ubiquinone biosynthesis O-methyltransferase
MGIDACMESICAAEMLSRDVIKRESLNLSYKTCTIGIYFSLRIPYNNLDDIEEFGTFDIIVASEVLEHVRDPEEFLRACSHKLGSEGMIFVSTINDTLMARLLVVEAAEKFLKIVPEGTHDPQKFVSIERLRRITKSLGPQFTISEVQGVAYFPILSQWRRVPTTAANYFAIIRKNKNSNKS